MPRQVVAGLPIALAAGSAAFVALGGCLGLSFGVRAAWTAWRGPAQAPAHALAPLVFGLLPVAWAVRWARRWAGVTGARAFEGPDFDLAAARQGLSTREREVAALPSLGRDNREIADESFIALQTVKGRNCRIFRKAGGRRPTALARRVMDALHDRGANPASGSGIRATSPVRPDENDRLRPG